MNGFFSATLISLSSIDRPFSEFFLEENSANDKMGKKLTIMCLFINLYQNLEYVNHVVG